MKQIPELLHKIESDRKIKILYACETGSRAWGFPSPDSDYDVRFLYMHNRDWYLSLSPKKDSIEIMDGDLDITGWDLRKCLVLLKKSNTPLIERFQSPITYYAAEDFKGAFRKLIDNYYSPTAVFFHHYSLAQKFWESMKDEEEIKLKSYFYLLRSLLSCYWITKDSSVLPMDIEGLMPKIDSDQRDQIRSLIQLKGTVGEKYVHKKDSEQVEWIKELFSLVEKAKDNLGVCKRDNKELDAFFLQMINSNAHN